MKSIKPLNAPAPLAFVLRLCVCLISILTLCGFSSPAMAATGSNCTGGVNYDDGGMEAAYQANSGGNRSRFAQYFRWPERSSRVTEVCVCLSRTETGPEFADVTVALLGPSENYSLGKVTWESGPYQGQQMEYRGFMPRDKRLSQANEVKGSIPVWPAYEWFSVAIDAPAPEFEQTWLEVDVPAGVLVCGDRSTKTNGTPIHAYAAQNTYTYFTSGDINGVPTEASYILPKGWTAPNCAYGRISPEIFPGSERGCVKALGLRAKVASDSTSAGCVPSETTLCLNEGRFSVAMEWVAGGNERDAYAASFDFSQASGAFYYVAPDNAEAMVKVIDACVPALGSKWWVFIAATTNTGYKITVTDTKTGEQREYRNVEGTPAKPVQDTAAFQCVD